MATAELISIVELNNKKFFVPSYQRGYRWTTAEIKALECDLFEFANKIATDDNYYCLQPIVVFKRDDDYYEIVDGQQRLTSLWLLSFAHYYLSRHKTEYKLNYDLVYEKKESFTSLLSNMKENVNNTDTFDKWFEKEPVNDIDSYNLKNNFLALFKQKIGNYDETDIIKKIFSDGISGNKDIKIIWYELDDNEKREPIQIFTDINANKIPLTEAELIKAALLYSCKDKHKRSTVALQWEEIEKGLNNNNFWSFMSGEESYSTRIDFLFEIWYSLNNTADNSESDGQADHYIFNTVVDKLEKKQGDIIWKTIQETYETLVDWYNNYCLYHMVGLFVEISDDTAAQTIKELYSVYGKCENKSNFEEKLKEKIIKHFNSSSYGFPDAFSTLINFKTLLKEEKDVLEKEKIESIKSALKDPDLNYNKKASKIKDILLLFNTSILINSKSTFERFPFDLYKEQKKQKGWDVEHVNPQTPKEKSYDEQRSWMTSYKQLIEEQMNCSKEADAIIEYLNELLSYNADELKKRFNEQEIEEKLKQFFKGESSALFNNDFLGNLVLLDAVTNRQYKNACFAEKRKTIIDIERNAFEDSSNQNTDKRYIMPGTKWVFFKEFNKAKQLIVWTESDMESYVSEIANSIFKMLYKKDSSQENHQEG